jgi:outer membrane protein assembly factor BamB
VPAGGAAVVLVDGRIAAQDAVQGPGRLTPDRWKGQRVEAVVFPATALRLQFDVPGLRSAEGVRLDLTVTLALRIEDLARFLTDVLRDASQFTEAELITLLRDTVRAGLAPAIRRRSLTDLDADLGLRGWLGTTIEHGLRIESDLAGRSGLAVVGVDAYDVRCPVWREALQAQESHYLHATLLVPVRVAQADAAGLRLLDEGALAELQAHLPVKEELVERKEWLAALEERAAAADARLEAARAGRRAGLQKWIAALHHPPSSLRPELWRRTLSQETHTAPLSDGQRVYCVTKQGEIFAFAGETGEPAWPRPAELGTAPGDGMALAAGVLWIPGHDGVLYGVDLTAGTLCHRIPIGGRLSSAPLAAGDLLYLSVDVDAETLRAGAGEVVAVDAPRRQVRQHWQVSQHGLRAQPALAGQSLYVGDRSGRLYALDVRRGRVEELPIRGGRILGAALVDERRSQIIIGDSYGRVLALDRAGRERWSQRLGGAVVGQPLLHPGPCAWPQDRLPETGGGVIYVGAGDGRVYALDPASGEPLREPFATRGPIATPPVGWGDLIFIGSNDGYLYALDTATGTCFWQYHSGSPVCVPPAVTADGRLYVVDSAGHLSALRWCLSRYAEAAHRAQEANPPRWAEATEPWLLAGEVQAAQEAAEKAGRLDLAADLAARLNWHPRAAQGYEDLARRSRDPSRAAVWWTEAAAMWALAGQDGQALRCRLEDARAREAPLLTLREANLPALTLGQPTLGQPTLGQPTLGQPDVVQVRITNETNVLAREVVLAYEGHVRQAGERPLGSLGPRESRLEAIEPVPTETGSTMLRVRVRYADPQGRPQEPVSLGVRLRVARPPEVHHHYYGPVVSGDGVIILRGEGSQYLRVQSGEEAVKMGRPAAQTCLCCGAPVEAGDQFCERCGGVIE